MPYGVIGNIFDSDSKVLGSSPSRAVYKKMVFFEYVLYIIM